MRKILVLAANPKDTTRLRLGEEVRDIGEGLQRSQRRDEFDLVNKWAVRPRDLQRAMLDEMPQIVHFSGHGEKEGLYFEDNVGQAKLVTGSALAGLFKLFAQKASIECVVLNGCYSEPQAEAIAAHIPYVIGMRKGVGDRAAIEFAVGFYDALSNGESVAFAFESGKVAMALNSTGYEEMPVLIKHRSSDRETSQSDPASTVGQSSNTELTAQNDLSKPMNPKDAIKVFFSYAHEDETLRDQLATHLKLLERTGVIKSWHDRQILPGQEWDGQIDDNLNTADIILLLVSADFLASDYCWDVEVKLAMQRHDSSAACVIPVILRAADWTKAPFGKLQALPKNAEPVTNWDNQDQAFTDIAKGIRRVAERLKQGAGSANAGHRPNKVEAPHKDDQTAGETDVTSPDQTQQPSMGLGTQMKVDRIKRQIKSKQAQYARESAKLGGVSGAAEYEVEQTLERLEGEISRLEIELAEVANA